MPTRLIAGAMSGTSADGVDAAVAAIDGRGLEMTARLIVHRHHAYPPSLRDAIGSIRATGQVRLDMLAGLGREISLAYVHAVQRALADGGLAPPDLLAVAAHGQTLFHQPPQTIQWIDPALLAAEVGCTVVSDFRRADCAAGGQGAPLVPFADFLLFRHPSIDRALVNIGGIANVTILPAGATIERLVAFDTGPGNCISDRLMSDQSGGQGIDDGGRRAASGSVNDQLFDALKRDAFFVQPPPKSTDGPQMWRLWEEAIKSAGKNLPLEDRLATACALTAWAIGQAVAPYDISQVVVSGGGVHNQTIMRMLREQVGARRAVLTVDDLGVPSQAKEALAFALLGAATLDGIPANVPSCTGAARPVILGSVTPRPW